MKERWFNFRPLCLIFGFLLLGSIFSVYIKKNIIISIIVCVITLVFFILIAILKKKPQYFLVPLFAFMVGVVSFNFATLSFNKSIDYQPTVIQARIYNISEEVNGMIKVEADNVQFDRDKIGDNISLFIYDIDGEFDNIEVGNYIKFKPYRFYKSDLFYNNIPNSKIYVEDLKYTVSVLIDDIEYVKTDKTLSEQFKENVKGNISHGLTNENVEIAYSALFGDKDLLSDKQYNAYKLSGVAHLLAVSGLHVGIITGILMKLTNYRKRRKWWKFFLITAFLFVYMYLCEYAVSIIRATIMSIILMLSMKLMKEYDAFNSIAIAGIVIFIINPLCVFDVAFLLSFSCVIGITMLYSPIKKALKKTKLPTKLVDAVSISLATTISIVIIMAYYFKTLNVISIVANVILIPIFTVAFSVLFVVSMLSVIPLFEYLTYLLYPINYIFDAINIIAIMLGNLSISNFNTTSFNFIAITIYFVLLLFMGRFCTAKHQYKLITIIPMVALLFYCLL